MSKLNNCGVVVKALLIVANVFVLLFGLATVAVGAFLLVVHEDLDFITDSDVFSGAVIMLAAGIAIVIVAVLGMAAASSEVWQLVGFYNVCMSGLIILGLGVAIFSYVEKDDISQRAKDNFFADIGSYKVVGDSDYDSGVNLFVDFFQYAGQCCGLNGFQDWFTENPDYLIENLNLPDSCSCSISDVDLCTDITATVSSWTKGCDESIDNLISAQAVYTIVVAIASVLYGVMVLSCSCGLCVLLLRHNRRVRRVAVNYTPLETYSDDIATNSYTQEQLKAPSYPPPSYHPTGHPDTTINHFV